MVILEMVYKTAMEFSNGMTNLFTEGIITMASDKEMDSFFQEKIAV